MPPSKARKPGKGNLYNRRKHKLKRRTKDLDQIHEDMKDKNAEPLLNQEVDYDKPGSAQFYCLHCARYFIDQFAMTEHFRSRNHKKRLKVLEESPYTQAEAEAAAGMGCYRPPKRQKVTTQPIIDKNV